MEPERDAGRGCSILPLLQDPVGFGNLPLDRSLADPSPDVLLDKLVEQADRFVHHRSIVTQHPHMLKRPDIHVPLMPSQRGVVRIAG